MILKRRRNQLFRDRSVFGDERERVRVAWLAVLYSVVETGDRHFEEKLQ